MYHVAGTGATLVILYLISYFFYRSNFYSLQFHRKLWNSILATAFVLTALAGLFLALQINYKWNIPAIKTILKWHVECGVAMAVTGLFHFIWHLSYFIKIHKKEEKIIPPPVPVLQADATDISTNLFIIGFISSSVQLLFLKEIMNITGGYEIIAGAFLCSWLIGSAAGSRLAPKSPFSDIGRINLYFSFGPLFSLTLMLLLSRLFLKPGETPSFLVSILFTSLVLIPFCIISGFTFIKMISAGKGKNILPGKSFSIETAGGIIAGIMISFLSAGILNTYQSLLLIIILAISYSVLTFYISHKSHKLLFKVVVLAASTGIILSSPDILFRQILLRGLNISETIDTPYGNVTIGEYQKDTSIYYNQRLLIYNNDVTESEEDIHYAMLQADTPRDVLLISGPLTTRISEIMKYDIQNIVYVERDPALTKFERTSNQKISSVLKIENDDALTFVRNTYETFDAIIMLLPPPSSLSLNRYYTLEFFTSVKSKMNKGGVFSCSPGVNTNYLNQESVRLYSSIFNSLQAVFKNVIPVCGNKIYFIASDKDLSTAICSMVRDKKIENIYVGPDYLADDLIASKSEEVSSLLDHTVRLNRASFPIASFYYQSFNLTKDLNEKIPAIILLFGIFILSARTLKKNNGIMFFSAFALAGYEILLLLILQLTAGNMYQITGLIISGLMAGLAVGSGIKIHFLEKKSYLFKVVILISLYLLSAMTVDMVMSLSGHFIIVVLLIISGFLPAVITGSFFRVLTFDQSDNFNTSDIYSADLAGSAIGFIVFSGFSVPLLGIRMSIFLLPFLILTGFLFILAGTKR